jgi:hypothetical protein
MTLDKMRTKPFHKGSFHLLRLHSQRGELVGLMKLSDPSVASPQKRVEETGSTPVHLRSECGLMCQTVQLLHAGHTLELVQNM